MKDTDIVRWEFTGDAKLAQAYVGFARKLLGQLNTQNTQNLQDQRLHSSAPGVTIDVGISFGQKWARIHALGGGGEYWKSVCKGFIVQNNYEPIDVLCWNVEEAQWYGPDLEDFELGLVGLNKNNQIEKLVEYRRPGKVMQCCVSYKGNRYYSISVGRGVEIYIDGRLLTYAPSIEGTSSSSIFGLTVVNNRILVIIGGLVRINEFGEDELLYRAYHTQFKLEYKDNIATWELGSFTYPEELNTYQFLQPILFSKTGTKGVSHVTTRTKRTYPYEDKSYILRVTATSNSAIATLDVCNILATSTTATVTTTSDEGAVSVIPCEEVDIPVACYGPPDRGCPDGWTYTSSSYSSTNTAGNRQLSDSSKYYFAVDFDDDTEVTAFEHGANDTSTSSCTVDRTNSTSGEFTWVWGSIYCEPPINDFIDIVVCYITSEEWSSTYEKRESSNYVGDRTMQIGDVVFKTYEFESTYTYSEFLNASGSTVNDCGSVDETSNTDWSNSSIRQERILYRYLLDFDLRFGGVVLYVEHEAQAKATVVNGASNFELESLRIELKIQIGEDITTLETYEFPSWAPTAITPTWSGGCSGNYNVSDSFAEEDTPNPLVTGSFFTGIRPGIAQSSLFAAFMRAEKDIYEHLLRSFLVVVRESLAPGTQIIRTPYAKLDAYGGNPATELSEYGEGWETAWYPYIHILGEGYLPPSKARVVY